MKNSILACVMFAAACGTSISYSPTNSPPRELMRRDPADVHVFATGLPNRPFVEIGLIKARQSSGFSTHGFDDILQEMRTEAGERGCDGLVVNGPRDHTYSTTTFSRGEVSSNTTTLEGYWGACIVFVDAPAGVAATSGSAP